MSKRNGKNKAKIAVLNEINLIDKKIKRSQNDTEKIVMLMSKRDTLRTKLKTK